MSKLIKGLAKNHHTWLVTHSTFSNADVKIVKRKCASTISQLGSGTERSVATNLLCTLRYNMYEYMLGTKDFLGQNWLPRVIYKNQKLPRSIWLTGADLSVTLHEILDAHIPSIYITSGYYYWSWKILQKDHCCLLTWNC